ncbi:hypothetical protein FRB95_006094 [Tulasnella sp. JGI-2019a]|nr:hypothetical protein FRB95_006094 [Tulasnella sp. JGI-2019a]
MSTFSLQDPTPTRAETPEPNVKQGRRNDIGNDGVQLLDADGDLSEKLEACLGHIFSKYLEPPFTSQHAENGLLVPEQGAYLTSTGLDRYAIDTNGQPFTAETKAELQEFLDIDEDGHLTLEGFLQIYALQSENDEEETWRDLSTHGFDRHLNLVSSRLEGTDETSQPTAP